MPNDAASLKAQNDFFDKTCKYKESCKLGLDNFGLKKYKGKSPAQSATLKLTCVNTITEAKYKIIYNLYTFCNPLILIFFIIFTNNFNYFQQRFIKEFNSKSIETRKFNIQVKGIPNEKIIEEMIKKFPDSNLTQEKFEKYAKAQIWMHIEKICEKKFDGMKTCKGNQPIAEVIDIQFGLMNYDWHYNLMEMKEVLDMVQLLNYSYYLSNKIDYTDSIVSGL